MKRLLPALGLLLLPYLWACHGTLKITGLTRETQDTLDVTVIVTLDSVPTNNAQVTVFALDHESCPWGFAECSYSTPFTATSTGSGRYRVSEGVTWTSCGRLKVLINLWVADGQAVEPAHGKRISWADSLSGCGPHIVTHNFYSGSRLTVTVSPDSVRLGQGGTFRLRPAVTDPNGEAVSYPITWSSSAPEIAAVDSSGVVTAVGEGIAVITGDVGGKPGHAVVTVQSPSATAVGPTAFVVGGDGVTVLDIGSESVLASPIDLGGHPAKIAATPDGTRVLVTNSGSNDVSIIDVGSRTASPLRIPVGTEPMGIAITPDGSRAYVANTGSNDISVIDLTGNRELRRVPLGGSSPYGIAVTPDGSRAYVADVGSNDVRMLDLDADTMIAAVIHPGIQPIDVAVTPDGARLYIAVQSSGTVVAVDVATETVVGSPIGVGRYPTGIAITPDGSLAYVAAHGSNQISVIDVARNARVATITVPGGPSSVAFTPDGTLACITSYRADYASLIDVATGTLLDVEFGVGAQPNGVVVLP